MAAPTADLMYLLTYTPRADAEDRGYIRWIRQVDNPFFNRVPGIAHYSNWRIVAPVPAARFRYFDFMALSGPDAVDRIYSNPEVKAFTAEWRALWGREPEASDTARNAEIFLACRTRIGRPMNHWAAFVPAASAEALSDGGFAGWQIEKGLRSEPTFRVFAVKFLERAADFDLLPVAIRASAVLAECFASPDRL
ncbi:MAG: hypothetical protein EXQ85_02005 [Alphaproteobacteria bacterium]|nr:hypothetical protein [Alphaproteobacteria bacterium]